MTPYILQRHLTLSVHYIRRFGSNLCFRILCYPVDTAFFTTMSWYESLTKTIHGSNFTLVCDLEILPKYVQFKGMMDDYLYTFDCLKYLKCLTLLRARLCYHLSVAVNSLLGTAVYSLVSFCSSPWAQQAKERKNTVKQYSGKVRLDVYWSWCYF